MIGFLINNVAVAFNLALWFTTGEAIAAGCAVVSFSLALASLATEAI